MGVQLGDLVEAQTIDFEFLKGRTVGIDAFNTLYQFLSIIRQPTGEPLKDSRGRVTSHLSGLLYRNVNLAEKGIKTAYIFDGEPPELKHKVVEQRNKAREHAGKKWKEALKGERLEEARTYAVQSARLSQGMVEEAKQLLELMGLPIVQAPGEGEAQAASMAARGKIFAAASQDFDSLLFGAPRLVRNLTITGKRKLPRKQTYVTVKPEIFYLEEILEKLGITRGQLVDMAILIGTDYNPKGVEGLGPKKAYRLVKDHGSAEKGIEEEGLEADFDLKSIRGLFLEVEVEEIYSLTWKKPDTEGVIRFLCSERDFSRERVEKALEKLEKAHSEIESQSSLDTWF